MKRLLLLISLATLLGHPALAQELPPHRLGFERWVRDTFFGGYRSTAPTLRWDIPASANRTLGNLPVQLKLVRKDTPIDLGEALRQYEIDEPFLLIVGFWDQPADKEPRLVNIVAAKVTPEQWRALWTPVTYANIQRLDAAIKDPGPTVGELRKRVWQMKNSQPFTGSVIQLNPRIDDRGQRRLLCSLLPQDLLKHLAPDAPTEQTVLFGKEFPHLAAAAKDN